MTSSARVVFDAKAELGEGPLWDPDTHTVVWVDIARGRIHRWDPASRSDSWVALGQPVGTVALRQDGGLVAALRDGIAFVLDDGSLDWLVDTRRFMVGERFNDGKCDSRGRLWVGSIALDIGSAPGVLYRVDPDGTVTPMLRNVQLSNGLGWSPDGSTMYFIDSLARTVSAFDFDANAGSIAGRRILVQLPAAGGLPDGMTVDAEGSLWVALHGGAAVQRYTSDGLLVDRIDLPAHQPTCLAFCGDELDQLWITSARENLSPGVLRAEPLNGALFMAEPGVRGVLGHRFGA